VNAQNTLPATEHHEFFLGAKSNSQFVNANHRFLIDFRHPQRPAPIVANNSTASNIANNTVNPKGSKVMDRQFYWMPDSMHQRQFVVC
jgi:hypothetical protein